MSTHDKKADGHILRYLKRQTMQYFRDGKELPAMHYYTECEDMECVFQWTWVDLSGRFEVLSCTPVEVLDTYPRNHALKSLLHNRVFKNLYEFTAACRNALGDNVESTPLVDSISVDGRIVNWREVAL